MSSLLTVYRKLTDETNQGIFDNEEVLLSQGRVYVATEIDIVFGGAAVVDFVFQAGSDIASLQKLEFQSASAEFKFQFFGGPTYDDQTGTPVALVNQLVGSPRLALSTAFLNPTISDPGVAGTEAVVRGVSGQGNRGGSNEAARSALSAISPNLPVLLRITNRGSPGVLDVTMRIGEFPTTTP